jgi:hypothetical protein
MVPGLVQARYDFPLILKGVLEPEDFKGAFINPAESYRCEGGE